MLVVFTSLGSGYSGSSEIYNAKEILCNSGNLEAIYALLGCH
jgi:hypothetical protein